MEFRLQLFFEAMKSKTSSISLAQEKTVLERIIGVKKELAFSHQKGFPAYFRNDCWIRAELGLGHHPTGETGTDEAFHCEFLPHSQLVADEVKSRPGRHAGARGTAVDFPFSENTNVPAVMAGIVRGTDDDDPIEETQIFHVGVT